MAEITATIRVQFREGDRMVSRVFTERFADNGNGVIDADEIRDAERRIRERLTAHTGDEFVDLTTSIHIQVDGTATGRRELDLPVGGLVNNGVVKLFGATQGCHPDGRWDRSAVWAPIGHDAAHGMPEEVNGVRYCYYREADRWDSVREMMIPGRTVRVPERVPEGANANNEIQLWDSGRNEWVRVGNYLVNGTVTTPGGRVPWMNYRTPEQMTALAASHAAPVRADQWNFHSFVPGSGANPSYQYLEGPNGLIARVPVGANGAAAGRPEILDSGHPFTSSAVYRPADAFDGITRLLPMTRVVDGGETRVYGLTGPTAGTEANTGYEMFTGRLSGTTDTRQFRRRAATPGAPGSESRPAVEPRAAGPLEVNTGTSAAPVWRVLREDGTLGAAPRAPTAHPPSGTAPRRVAPRRSGVGAREIL